MRDTQERYKGGVVVGDTNYDYRFWHATIYLIDSSCLI